ncbi:MAG: hypothetical protein HC845_03720 [Akkermansiaceae bacterium]|nr:hypothetical protein [Akkermansiaceae bacterium]
MFLILLLQSDLLRHASTPDTHDAILAMKKSKPEQTAKTFRIHWSDKHIAMLGKVPDSSIAKIMGVSVSTVFQKRKAFKISPTREMSRFRWDKKSIAMLGKAPDIEVARKLGLKLRHITKRRLALGIQCFARASSLWREWSPKEIALLGKMRDTELANLLGINGPAVTAKRLAHRIPSFVKRAPNRKPKREEDWTKKEISLIGTMTDEKLADVLNISIGAVRSMRLALDIPPYRKFSHRWSKKVIDQLGRVPDRQIADEIGVCRDYVRQKRKSLGIPIYQPK